MRIAGETVGPRGFTVLAVAAVAGLLLGVHGWSGRHNGLPPGLAGAGPPTSPTRSSPARSSPPRSSPAPTPGPKLSSQSYASYSFQEWPGSVSGAAKAAATGLVITVRKKGAGIMVTAGVAGQPTP